MVRALDTSRVVLPGLPTSRVLARLFGMLVFCLGAAIVTTYAHYFVLYALGEFRAESIWAPWREAWLGGFFWDGVVFGTLWASYWALARLWNRRWIRAGILITAGTLGMVLLSFAVGIGAIALEFSWIAFASVRLGGAKWTART